MSRTSSSRRAASSREEITTEIRAWLAANAGAGHAGRSDLLELITTALEVDYVSRSCRGGVKTGNHYQSVRLGNVRTSGFRTGRKALLDQIDFEGRTVLDLGSNLGELSREARERGATRVVGVEYDEYFVTVADALNAFNGVDGVEFGQGDIGDPRLYREHFDIVLAFSVFEYIHGVVAEVAAVTGELLVLETHKLDGNLESQYLEPFASYLPAYRSLGRSEWGRALDERAERAVVAFAGDEPTLRGGLRDEGHVHGSAMGKRVEIDVSATAGYLHERFLSMFSFGSLAELLAAIRTTTVDFEAMAGNADMRRGYRGWLYWFTYLKGYVEYLERGSVEADNVFCRYLAERHLPQVDEPGMASSDLAAITARRYRDLDRMRAFLSVDKRELVGFVPVRLILSDPPPANPLCVRLADGETLAARMIDGWHRLFAAALCGVPTLSGDVARERYPGAEGRVERFEIGDGDLRLNGWCVAKGGAWDFLEVRVDGRTVGRVTARRREDVANAFPELSDAAASGFSLTARVELTDSPTRVDLLPMRAWMPVGRLRLYHVPDMAASETTAFGEAVAAIGGPFSGEGTSVLAVGPVQAALARAFLPLADIRQVNGEAALPAVGDEPCSFLASGDALAHVPQDDRAAWLALAVGLLAPGGAIFIRGRSTLPRKMPEDLRHHALLPHDPVEAIDSVVLTRA